MEELVAKLYDIVTVFGLRILAAAAIFIIGRWAAKIVRHLLSRVMEKAKVDATLISFVGHLCYAVVLMFAVIAAIGKLGVQTASFVAVLGAAGLAIGLSLQGSLANFASGVLIIIFRPFKIDDFIEGAGTAGTVEEIQIFTTQLRTPDNKTIIMPNAKLMAGEIVNYSAKPTRRMDLVFGVGYGDDLDRVYGVLREMADTDERILKDPAPKIAVKELGDSSVNFLFRIWVQKEDYWDVQFDTTEKAKRRFDEAGINIPFPQRDVHLYRQAAE